MKTLRITLPIFLALLLALAPGLALAQNLGQQLAWPEIGFNMAYPAGWVEITLDDQTKLCSARTRTSTWKAAACRPNRP